MNCSDLTLCAASSKVKHHRQMFHVMAPSVGYLQLCVRKASVFQNHTQAHSPELRREMGTERLFCDQVALQDKNELVSVSFVNNADGIITCVVLVMKRRSHSEGKRTSVEISQIGKLLLESLKK